jgi:hypothetical protein
MSTPEGQAAEDLARHAQHECGHAAVSWALGIPFDRITLDATYPHADIPKTIGQHWLIQCCGAIADQQRRGLRMRDSEILKMVFGGGPDDRFEIDNAATGEVAVRPSRLEAVGPGRDLHDMAEALSKLPMGRAECLRVWRGSEKFAEECRPAIDALAAAFLANGELSYDEAAEIAAAVMTGKPNPEIPLFAQR